MSRAPRRQFLAPFILTVAAAIPGCKSKSDTTTVRHVNPPADPYRTWNVWTSEEGCEAVIAGADDCPPDASCNPPPPMEVACPEGMTADSITIVQAAADGPCTLGDAVVACPEQLETFEEDVPDEGMIED